MKILFLSHSFYPRLGGIESNTELLAAAFAAAGHDLRLLTWTEDPIGRVFPYPVTRNPGTIELLWAHRWADLVFENNPCFRLGRPALLFRRPTVMVINTWITRPDGRVSLRDKIKTRWWLKRCARVIAVSDAIRRTCWPAATVIRNPYRANEFYLDPAVDRDADFVFLGRLVPDKGVSQAIEAIYRIRLSMQKEGECRPYPVLTIIGDGPERKALEKQAAGLSLQNAVVFAGALTGEPLRKMLNRHRYMLVPSAWKEPFGNVVLEGMACGCLPIASNGGGLPEAIGNAGLTFQRNNTESLVHCIRRIREDQDLERRLREEASRHLVAHHPSTVAHDYLRVIENVYSHKKYKHGNR